MVFNFFRSKRNRPVGEEKPVIAESIPIESVLAAAPDEAAIQRSPALEPPALIPEVQLGPLTFPDIRPAEASLLRADLEIQTSQAQEQPTPQGQLDTLKATREDVIAAYKIFLGRLPESMEVVGPRVGVTPMTLLVDFLTSKEFLDQPTKSQLVLAVAKKIVDARMAQDAKPSAEEEPIKSA